MLNHVVMWKIKEDVEDKEKVKLDIKLDTSDVPSIKEARLVHINGKAKLVKDIGKYDDNYTSPYQIKLNVNGTKIL